MKKSISFIILVVVFLASCQAKPVSEPTATIAPTNTLEPTATLIPFTPTPSSTPAPPTPTEIFINPDYLAGLEKEGFDRQFPLATIFTGGTHKEVKITFCAMDFKDRIKVDFEYANLVILRVTKCYFLDVNGKHQFVTIPVLIYNKDLDFYFNYGNLFVDGKRAVSDDYFDNIFKGYVDRIPYKKYTLLHFEFNTKDPRTKFLDSFFEKAVTLFGEPSEKFFNEGDVSEFPDYLGADNFVVPSSMYNDRGE